MICRRYLTHLLTLKTLSLLLISILQYIMDAQEKIIQEVHFGSVSLTES